MAARRKPYIASKPRRKEQPRPLLDRPGHHCVVCMGPKLPGTFPICDRCRK